jgi:hypothetical protein
MIIYGDFARGVLREQFQPLEDGQLAALAILASLAGSVGPAALQHSHSRAF